MLKGELHIYLRGINLRATNAAEMVQFPGRAKRRHRVNFSCLSTFYSVRKTEIGKSWGRKLFCIDADDADLRKCTIPVLGDCVKNQPEVFAVARLKGNCRKRLGINIRLARTDDPQRRAQSRAVLESLNATSIEEVAS